VKAVAACLVLTGCFYIDPINQLPVVEPITCRLTTADRPCGNESYLHRNDEVELAAEVFDPDERVVRATYAWTAFACTDAPAIECDDLAYYSSNAATPVLGWPRAAVGVRSIRVKLDVRDSRGALATQSAKFFVNDPPTLELRASQRGNAVGAPMELVATYSDPDEGPTNLHVAWDVLPPAGDPAVVLEDGNSVTAGNPSQITVSKRLVPSRLGLWDVKVTATDARAETTEKRLTFEVGADLPPCLARVQPIVPPDDAALPIVEPTVFQVPLVEDDLDAYPRTSSDPAFGTTTFAWSILPPGASQRQLLVGATGNSIDFDPAVFIPGQRVELRVEIFDRNHAAIPCADDAPTCATAARPQCVQRQTWRVEIR
jgi:hypothetical protein